MKQLMPFMKTLLMVYINCMYTCIGITIPLSHAGRLPEPEKSDVLNMLQNELGIYKLYIHIQCFINQWYLITGVNTVSFSDWEAIDRHEIREGTRRGKPREKIVDFNKMMDIINTNR